MSDLVALLASTILLGMGGFLFHGGHNDSGQALMVVGVMGLCWSIWGRE